MATGLTALAVQRAAARTKAYKLGAGGGLYLLVEPSGCKYWRWKYRYADNEKKLSLGVYLQMSLADARRARDEARYTPRGRSLRAAAGGQGGATGGAAECRAPVISTAHVS